MGSVPDTSFVPNADLRVPLGSLFLVTGASGMIATHIADEALKAGFKVRGTVRSREKGEELARRLQSSDFEYVIVPDLATDLACHKAMENVVVAMHTASLNDFTGNITTIASTISAVDNFLTAAASTPTVKSVVITSSITAASGPRPGVKFTIDENTWNNDALETVKVTTTPEAQAKLGDQWGANVYFASKIGMEKATWTFVRERKPSFAVNVVIPALNWGKLIGNRGKSVQQLDILLQGELPKLPSMYMIDTIDDARIHIAAALDSSVSNRRIYACDSPFNWTQVIKIVQELRPTAILPAPEADELMDISTIDNALGAELLQKWWSQSGYKGLRQTVEESISIH